ncbi:MAG: GTPase [Spirulinaceae cyanobacterium RM2_2_10]|nr:GTPase [Spirulinaceae cyanobacterium SM2_1_0]NJO19031.1 GTPase [Spirulinaceae cyanobacterium RM2_2_10]
MKRLPSWQWLILATPPVAIASFLLIAASWQLHTWGLTWLWGVFILILAGWRVLLARWTRPLVSADAVLTAALDDLQGDLPPNLKVQDGDRSAAATTILQQLLTTAESDPPLWTAPQVFWQRCQQLLTKIAQLYYPDIKYPLLNIYIPDAYRLLRGTIDDLDRWIESLAPVLNQMTVGQAYQAWERYQALEPVARRLWRFWNWAQWLLNPAAAAARWASQSTNEQATQQLLVNFSQLLRAALLRNLCQQAIALYSGQTVAIAAPSQPAPAKTQTLQVLLAQAEPEAKIATQPVNILLVGRTGAGKSSLINTLFQAEQAAVDVLPSTDAIQQYQWQSESGETLNLWDTPGYEQVAQAEQREAVLDQAHQADLVLLVLPALDPALQMEADFLTDLQQQVSDLPVIAVVTQVDRLRPLREWQPPYDWPLGDRAKEKSIREAVQYRAEALVVWCDRVLPVVTAEAASGRASWNDAALAQALLDALDPAKQLRLARFLRDREARATAAAAIVDRYAFQMTTQQGLAAFLKSPVLQFISTLSTGSPDLARLLAADIPVEQLPVVIGKLQMAYELHDLLNADSGRAFELRSLWPLLLDNPTAPERNAWAFGQALVAYWRQDLTLAELRSQFHANLESHSASR